MRLTRVVRGSFRSFGSEVTRSNLWTHVDDVVGDRFPNHNILWWK